MLLTSGMPQKTYVVTGASGHVSRAVVESLQAHGLRLGR
jgi:uncharacterized protein YbjT (DUF2867 family)